MREKAIERELNLETLAATYLTNRSKLDSVQHLFHFAMFSEQTGTTPIEEELFKSAIRELKLQPAEVISVGNRLDTEIMSANEIGITSVRIRRGEYGI